MPELGRPTASAGNAYHDVTTALRLVEMVQDGQIEYVWPEAVAPVDDIKVAFVSSERFEQVKEHAPASSWTAAGLQSEGILDQFARQHALAPEAQLVLVTASDARNIRELTTRAASALRNSPGNPAEAVAEWRSRLSAELDAVASDIGARLGKSDEDTIVLLATVVVQDNQGSLDQRRDQLNSALNGLVKDVARGATALEDLARDCGMRRDKIRRSDVRHALAEAEAGPLTGAWAAHVDLESYAAQLDERERLLDPAALPELGRTLALGGSLTEIETVTRPTLLTGGHGAGKTHMSLRIAIGHLTKGRPGLHVMLGAWATGLDDLIHGELAFAAGRPVTDSDVSLFLANEGSFLILDSLDEVAPELRQSAVREVHQLARSHPNLRVLVTARPGAAARQLGWPEVELQPLTDEQIAGILGSSVHSLPAGVQALARNPLMLGLLRTHGTTNVSEPELLDGLLASMIDREAQRPGRLDAVTATRIAEEVAFRWLLGYRTVLDDHAFRGLARDVAHHLAEHDRIELDARQIEASLLEMGLVVRVGSQLRPLHRTLLDQLAARRFSDPGSVEVGVVTPSLREAFARYIGTQLTVEDRPRSMLEANLLDIELLARCARLVRSDVAAPSDANAFARDYLRAVRTLTEGPLSGAALIAPAVHIKIDHALTWISESEVGGASGDRVEVVENSGRMYTVGPDGIAVPNITRFSGLGFEGRIISNPMPQLVAYERVRDALQDRLKNELLPDEGPQITYERLAAIPKQLADLASAFGSNPQAGYAMADLVGITPLELLSKFATFAASIIGHQPTESDVAGLLLGFDFQAKSWFAITSAEPSAQDPRNPSGGRRGLVLHGSPISMLVGEAMRLGIANLPLHPLGVLPEGTNDPVLSLPVRIWELHGDDLRLFVLRQEQGIQAAIRHLVTHNLEGVASRLRTYGSMPWRVRVHVENKTTGGQIDMDYARHVDFRTDVEGVEVELGIPAGWDYANGSSRGDLRFSYGSVLKEAYREVSNDLNALLSGRQALGAEDLG